MYRTFYVSKEAGVHISIVEGIPCLILLGTE